MCVCESNGPLRIRAAIVRSSQSVDAELTETITIVWILDTHISNIIHVPFGWVLGGKTFLWDYLRSVKSCRHCHLLLAQFFFLEMRNNKNKSDAEMRSEANHTEEDEMEMEKCRNNAEHK